MEGFKTGKLPLNIMLREEAMGLGMPLPPSSGVPGSQDPGRRGERRQMSVQWPTSGAAVGLLVSMMKEGLLPVFPFPVLLP